MLRCPELRRCSWHATPGACLRLLTRPLSHCPQQIDQCHFFAQQANIEGGFLRFLGSTAAPQALAAAQAMGDALNAQETVPCFFSEYTDCYETWSMDKGISPDRSTPARAALDGYVLAVAYGLSDLLAAVQFGARRCTRWGPGGDACARCRGCAGAVD